MPTDVVAASGSNVLARGKTLQVTTDNGQTWQPSAFEDHEDLWVAGVDAGQAVMTDYQQTVDVFNLAANANVEYSIPGDAGEVWSADSRTALTGFWDSDLEEYWYYAIDLATGNATGLSSDYYGDGGWPSGWDSNDQSEMYGYVGEQGAVLQTNYIYDNVQVATDIDPLLLNGEYGGDPFRVTGYVPYVGVTGDRVEYVKRVSTAISLCSRPLDGVGETCTRMATLASAGQSVWADRSGEVIRLALNGVEYFWEANTLKKVAYTGSYAAWTGTGIPTRPLLSVQNGTVGATFAVQVDGTTTKVFDDLRSPIQPYPIDLAGGRLTGSDQRGATWTRPVTSSAIGEETTLPGAVDWVAATAGRTVTGIGGALTFYDRGSKRATATVTGSLVDASGPYALVKSKGNGSLRTAKGAVAATNPQAVFGSLYVGLMTDSTKPYARVLDAAVEHRPFDLYPNAVFSPGTWNPAQTHLWGDWITFDIDTGETGANGEELTDTHVYHMVDGGGGWGWAYFGGSVVSMGDGVAVVYDRNTGTYVLWNFVSNDRTGLPDDAWQPVLDDVDRVAYADSTHLVVQAVPGAGASAPRLLGTEAASSFNPNAGAWKPEFDATKPLAEGTLSITRVGDPMPSRVLTVPASADGSIRDLSWDGKDGLGDWVADGTFTWTLNATDAGDAGKLLVAVDGASAVSGSVMVKTANLGTVTAVTPKVSDATPTVDQPLTAVTGTWKPTNVHLAYQWYRDSTAIASATTGSYTPLPTDAGHTLKVKVTGSCPGTEAYCRGYATANKTSASTSTVAKATISPAPAAVPGVTTPVVDQLVTPTLAPWGPDPITLTHQWYKVNSRGIAYAISGAKALTFSPTGSEVGYKLKLKVTGTRSGYNTKSVYSALTGKVVAASFTSVPDPTVTGSLTVGMPLTAVPGSSDPSATYGYQWYRGTSAISGATASTYRTTGSDLAKMLKVRVTYKRSGYTPVVKYASAAGAIEPGLAAVTPRLDDTTPAVGQVLAITDATSIGAWAPADAVATYQWYRDSTMIDHATGATYDVQAADLGKAIKVKVTGTKVGYASVSKSSAASSDVAKGTFTAKPVPTLQTLTDNTAHVGETLTAVPGIWTPAPTSFTYVWYRSGVAISGATQATYALVAADSGKLITVKVTAVRSGFTSASVTSLPTGSILA